jgi:hypothetical protein
MLCYTVPNQLCCTMSGHSQAMSGNDAELRCSSYCRSMLRHSCVSEPGHATPDQAPVVHAALALQAGAVSQPGRVRPCCVRLRSRCCCCRPPGYASGAIVMLLAGQLAFAGVARYQVGAMCCAVPLQAGRSSTGGAPCFQARCYAGRLHRYAVP